LFDDLFTSGRAAMYDSRADEDELETLRDLLRIHLGRLDLETDQLVVTNGSTEAISVACAAAARQGAAVAVPLPSYYAYELSAARAGVPLAGHHGAEGTTVADLGRPVWLFVNEPESTTGAGWEPPGDLVSGAACTIHDLVYQLDYDARRGLARSRARRAASDLGRAALVMTPSKDLALPGLRAGLLVTEHRGLLDEARAIRFERYFSLNPLVLQVLVVYVALLVARSDGAVGWSVARRILADRWPGRASAIDGLEGFGAHVDALVLRCADNLAWCRAECSDVFADDDALRYENGYSYLPVLRGVPADVDVVEALASRLGRDHGLRMNPTYLFGGDPDAWAKLYPDRVHVRVNLSERRDALAAAVDRLRAGLASERPDRRRVVGSGA
jgi:hypothetical protein